MFVVILVSVILLVLSIILLSIANFVSSFPQNILIGIGTNLIGIIVNILFVESALNRNNKKIKKEQDKEKIMNYCENFNMLLSKYIIAYCRLITPVEKINNLHPFTSDFKFNDLKDLHSPSLFTCENIFGSSIENFYKYEKRLNDLIKNFIINCNFEDYKIIKNKLKEFIKVSTINDVSNAILNNKEVRFENCKEKLVDSIKEMIAKFDEEKLSDISGSNVLLPYKILYNQLKDENKILCELCELLEKHKLVTKEDYI